MPQCTAIFIIIINVLVIEDSDQDTSLQRIGVFSDCVLEITKCLCVQPVLQERRRRSV